MTFFQGFAKGLLFSNEIGDMPLSWHYGYLIGCGLWLLAGLAALGFEVRYVLEKII
jgi:hypothetical protein